MSTKQRQALLVYLGYDPGMVDGVDGPKTQAAMAKFLDDYGVNSQAADMNHKALLDAVSGKIGKSIAESTSKPQNNFAGPGIYGSKYFVRDEFRCPCGKCGGFPVEPRKELVSALDIIREHFNAPITIVPLPPANAHAGGSGIRCRSYNDSLKGSVPNSRHIQGKAADILVRGFSGETVKAYCDGLVTDGMLRYCYVISGGNSVHVDVA